MDIAIVIIQFNIAVSSFSLFTQGLEFSHYYGDVVITELYV